VFSAVARADSLTQAAKQLGLAQPSLSQQLARLEAIIDLKLFERRSSQLALTPAGNYLLPRVEDILRRLVEMDDGLAEFRGGTRAVIRISGIRSILRAIMPAAMHLVQETAPNMQFDLHDNAPAEILDLLYARKIDLGLVPANSIAEAGSSFLQIPILTDAYVLIVPEWLDLSAVHDPRRDLDPRSFEVLNRSIQFTFGTHHSNRVEDWYDRHLPDHQVVAHCRSFEMAIEMVRSGLGVCLAPTLTCMNGGELIGNIRLYDIEEPPRRIVALIASQHRRLPPFAALLDALQTAGAAVPIPRAEPVPLFLAE